MPAAALARLEERGHRAVAVPVGRLEELRKHYEDLSERGLLDERLAGELLTGLSLRPPDAISHPRSLIVVATVRRRGVKVSFVWLRLMVLKYLHEYARLTREETGHVGPLFYHYIVPLNVALVMFVILAVSYWAQIG